MQCATLRDTNARDTHDGCMNVAWVESHNSHLFFTHTHLQRHTHDKGQGEEEGHGEGGRDHKHTPGVAALKARGWSAGSGCPPANLCCTTAALGGVWSGMDCGRWCWATSRFGKKPHRQSPSKRQQRGGSKHTLVSCRDIGRICPCLTTPDVRMAKSAQNQNVESHHVRFSMLSD